MNNISAKNKILQLLDVLRELDADGTPSKVDQRRLRDGATALALPTNFAEMSSQELLEMRRKLFDGAVALQSMDDLGSKEANDKAMRDLEELVDRIRIVDVALAQRPPSTP